MHIEDTERLVTEVEMLSHNFFIHMLLQDYLHESALVTIINCQHAKGNWLVPLANFSSCRIDYSSNVSYPIASSLLSSRISSYMSLQPL